MTLAFQPVTSALHCWACGGAAACCAKLLPHAAAGSGWPFVPGVFSRPPHLRTFLFFSVAQHTPINKVRHTLVPHRLAAAGGCRGSSQPPLPLLQQARPGCARPCAALALPRLVPGSTCATPAQLRPARHTPPMPLTYVQRMYGTCRWAVAYSRPQSPPHRPGWPSQPAPAPHSTSPNAMNSTRPLLPPPSPLRPLLAPRGL